MARFVAERYDQRLSIEEIARSVGLHPKYAMTLFKKTYGRSLLHYLTHHRISHAQRLLATTQRKILDIAFESGFGSASQFYEVFNRFCKCTPRAYQVSCCQQNRVARRRTV